MLLFAYGTGNPHVYPSVIVTKLMERFQISEDKSIKSPDYDGLKELLTSSHIQNNEPT